MVGDVNLFFNNNHDHDDEDGVREAEVEVMIAERCARGKGMGKESVIMMLHYGHKYLSVSTYIVKIGNTNKESIHLFLKLGFRYRSHSEVFEETTYELDCSTDEFKNVLDVCGHVEVL